MSRPQRQPRSPLFLLALGLLTLLLPLSLVFARSNATDGRTVEFQYSPGSTMHSGEVIRVLCFRSNDMADFLGEFQLSTDGDGRGQLPASCTHAAAFFELEAQPDKRRPGHYDFWVYATSFPPGQPALSPTTDPIQTPLDQRLVIFDVHASLAWDADETTLQDVADGLANASTYLYDLTDGQMAFGPITIDEAGEGWQEADLRFKAANDFRPAAYVGGIVPERISYTGKLETVYAPGAVYLGRNWNRRTAMDAVNGRWSQPDGSRTLAHEWLHYAAFLYDSYLGRDGRHTHCSSAANRNPATDETNATAMDWHYTSSELWLTTPPDCEATMQWQVHGLTDWQTLAGWSLIQGLPPVSPIPPGAIAPNDDPTLVKLLFAQPARRDSGRVFLPSVRGDGTVRPAPTPVAPSTLAFPMETGLPRDRGLPAELYVFEGSATDPDRIVYQGSFPAADSPSATQTGLISAVGLKPDQFVHAYAQTYALDSVPSTHFVIAAPAEPLLAEIERTGKLTGSPKGWFGSLDVSVEFGDAGVKAFTAQLTELSFSAEAATFQLCVPDPDVGCPAAWRVVDGSAEARSDGGYAWTARFEPQDSAEMPLYALLHVSVPDGGEITRWIQVAGGVGPGHQLGDAPMADGMVMVNTLDDSLPGSCNRVLYMPAFDFSARQTPIADALINQKVRTLVHAPLDIDILLPQSDGSCPTPGFGDRQLPAPVAITLFYDGDWAAQQGVDPNQLAVAKYTRFVPGQGAWKLLPTISTDPNADGLNMISAETLSDGIFAIVALE